MTREEFCKLMEKAKVVSNVSRSEISFSMKMLLPALRSFEKGEHNFNMAKVMEYLKVINAQLMAYNNRTNITFADYNQLLVWIIFERKHNYTQRQLAEAIGISYVMLARIESKKSNLSIDIFLKIVDKLDYDIKIINK